MILEVFSDLSPRILWFYYILILFLSFFLLFLSDLDISFSWVLEPVIQFCMCFWKCFMEKFCHCLNLCISWFFKIFSQFTFLLWKVSLFVDFFFLGFFLLSEWNNIKNIFYKTTWELKHSNINCFDSLVIFSFHQKKSFEFALLCCLVDT